MRKVVYYLNFAVGLFLLAGILVMSFRPEPWAVDREKGFIGGLHNSLYYLDEAKWKWMEEKHKAEGDVPTMEDLAPYLGEWTNHIARFIALGITYKITPISELPSQSDVATLTHDLRFRRGYCLFYSAGTSYCLHTGWTFPPHRSISSSFRTLYIENNLDHLLEVAFTMLVAGNLFVFLRRKSRNANQAVSQ